MQKLQRFIVIISWLYHTTMVGGCSSKTLAATPFQLNFAHDIRATSSSWVTPAKMILGSVGIASIPVSAPAAGALIAAGCIYHAKDHIARACQSIGRGFAWVFGMSTSIGDEAKNHLKKTTSIRHALHEIDQMANPESNDDGTYRIYDPSPKHYPIPQKGASPAPGWILGQLALNSSWEVMTAAGPSTMRIAYCQGRIVMFKLTYSIGKFKVYHGYYQTQDDIDGMNANAREVLKNHNVINHRNKIIK
jgi:hypothetical protein